MPLALGIGTGAQLHQPLSIAVIVGFIIALAIISVKASTVKNILSGWEDIIRIMLVLFLRLQASSALSFFENPENGFVIYPLHTKSFLELHRYERVGILPWKVGKLHSNDWKNYKEKLVIQQPVPFQNKTYFNLHRLLRSINKNCLLLQFPVRHRLRKKTPSILHLPCLNHLNNFRISLLIRTCS